jgi:hypothetical protein
MKTIAFILSVFILVSFSKNNEESIDIFDAINKNLVKVNALSIGGHSGQSIVVEIENLSTLKSVLIPSGTRFISEHKGDQDLLNVDDEIIVLNAKSTSHTLNGFCVQSHNSSPAVNSAFTLSKESNLSLIKLAKYLNKKEFNNNIKQTALWCISNGHDVSGIYAENNEEVKKLRTYVCTLAGVENVWYNTDPTYTMDENRNIIQETTKVEGLISYNVTKRGNLKMEVCNEDGEAIRSFAGSNSISQLGEYRFNFKLKVKGWISGTYSVEVKSDSYRIGDDIIHKEFFEIG